VSPGVASRHQRWQAACSLMGSTVPPLARQREKKIGKTRELALGTKGAKTETRRFR
jgi:hypothetical protein